jgi:DNA-binding NtrC family response regulator
VYAAEGQGGTMDLPWKVMIISMDSRCSSHIAELLAAWKMEALLAADYSEAARLLANQGMLLAFCDLDLAADGFRKMVELFSAQKKAIRVVALVGEEREQSEAVLLGAFDAISLSCERSDVQWVVARAMRDQESRRRDTSARDLPPGMAHADSSNQKAPAEGGPNRSSDSEQEGQPNDASMTRFNSSSPTKSA